MSVNYEISDIFNYTYTGTVSTTDTGTANANTGLLYRDAANDDEVRILAAGAVDQVLTITATNVIGWSTPAGDAVQNTPFLVTPTTAQTISTSVLTSFTNVVWGTETLDPGNNFATNVYTLPLDGTYYFATMIEWAPSNKSNAGERHVRIVVDPTGTPVKLVMAKEQPNSNKNIAFYQHLSTLYSGTTGDAIGVQASQNSGGNNDLGVESQFFGWLVAKA